MDNGKAYSFLGLRLVEFVQVPSIACVGLEPATLGSSKMVHVLDDFPEVSKIVEQVMLLRQDNTKEYKSCQK